MFREQKAKREICFASHFGASITRDAVPAGKAVVTRRIPSIFRALCRRLCAQQNTKSGFKTFQDHWNGQGIATTRLAPAFAPLSKSAKRKRHMAKSAVVHSTDVARIKSNMPFG
jgi:hypothetical protein